jgi:hypothetical protein
MFPKPWQGTTPYFWAVPQLQQSGCLLEETGKHSSFYLKKKKQL